MYKIEINDMVESEKATTQYYHGNTITISVTKPLKGKMKNVNSIRIP